MTLPSAAHLFEMRQEFALDVGPTDRRWEYVRVTPDRAIILPDRLPAQLFRGQNARFIPCRTALGRGLSQTAKPQLADLTLNSLAKLATRLVWRMWFCKELEEHPGARWLADQKLKGFEFALAQHYGIPTGYMDLSESFDVSCFFATCYMDRSGRWHPCVSGSGVMYLLPTERIPIRPEMLQPIGLQVLPRPLEQFGWVIVCGIDVDFEDLPGLELFEFDHEEIVSNYFLNMFSSGRDLFPDDAMASVADLIVASNSLPEAIVISVAESLARQVEGLAFDAGAIIAEIRGALGFSLRRDFEVFDHTLRSQADLEWSARAPGFLRNVGFSIVRT